MTDDEALGLIQSLKVRGVEIRQRGRLLHIERGAQIAGGPLRELISRNWSDVARAVAAHRQADRLIARIARKGGASIPC